MVSRKVRLLIPRDRGELVPIFFILFLICIYTIFELFVILPSIYHNIFTYKEILHLIFGLYIIYNLLGNMILCMITDTSTDTIICPVLLPPPNVKHVVGDSNSSVINHYNWHYCNPCEVNVPPRAQHCHLCKKCILKREHHCSFLGRCIGYRNIRYYICFIFWAWFGLIYCNALHFDYTYELVGKFSYKVIIACVFPFGAWLFGLLDHFSLLLSFICSTSVVMNLYLMFLLFKQFFLIYNGQTSYESVKNIKIYSMNTKSNIEHVFGKNWHLILFSPLISSTPLGDGMTFDIYNGDTKKKNELTMNPNSSRVEGTDGSDFIYRERVAGHYQISTKIKSRLRLLIYLHFLLALIIIVQILLYHIRSFFPSSVTKPHIWEYLWLISIFASICGLCSLSRNNLLLLKLFFRGVIIFGLGTILSTIIINLTDLFAYSKLKTKQQHEQQQQMFFGLPVLVLWYIFLAITVQVHSYSLYLANTLIKSWQPRQRQQ
ncbi:unnamed protein product [Didymodactylos carnosus]|uniref:Palmitoyltransferase n=1 Tax=Didymodactylos carnosus TaxID=1234261 RepID=A0A8S2DRA0_9BILA|nr:unnamed protein product [Didymodactylos carnosus]CAF3799642.1 unnamed protein product [Didymodactylos carnosus]